MFFGESWSELVPAGLYFEEGMDDFVALKFRSYEEYYMGLQSKEKGGILTVDEVLIETGVPLTDGAYY